VTRRDDRYHKTPLEWAEHFGHDEVKENLRKISAQ
jgi:ankyrin repeat protein